MARKNLSKFSITLNIYATEGECLELAGIVRGLAERSKRPVVKRSASASVAIIEAFERRPSMTASELCRRMQGFPKAERDEALNVLLTRGEVLAEKRKRNGDKPTTTYRYVPAA